MSRHEWDAEVDAGERFRFGENWRRYSAGIGPTQVGAAKEALANLLRVSELTGRTFLDVGCGSGIHSLAARELGATVRAFDYDPDAVETAQHLLGGDGDSVVEQGSVLDGDYLGSLGTFDIVYSWGVLHHTGAMWDAIANVAGLVAPSGLLAIAIYNDQGRASRRALAMKRRYNRSGRFGRAALLAGFTVRHTAEALAVDIVRRRNPLNRYRGRARGMSVWRDIVDWVGGYPFEVATAAEVIAAIEPRGFQLVSLRDVGRGSGNNEFVFRRSAHGDSPRKRPM